MSRPRGKTTATTLVLLAGGSVVVAVMNWEALVTEYYVYRLRRDPELFEAVLSSPRSGLEEAARDRYVRTSHGRLRLGRKFVDGLFAFLEPQDADLLPASLGVGQIVSFGLYRVGERPYFLIDGPRTIAKPAGSDSRVLRLKPFLELIDHTEFRLAEYPEVKLSIWSYEDVLNQNEVIVEGRMVREENPSALRSIDATVRPQASTRP